MPLATTLLRISFARLAAILLAASLFGGAAPAARADEADLLPPVKLDRKFPQGQFCAIKVSMPFTATGTTARILFEAKRFVFDTDGITLLWTQQYIDNVVVAKHADYLANFGPPPSGSQSEFCYIGDATPTPYFYFNRSGLTLPLKELFDVNPAGTGWDLANGAYWRTDHTGPRNPETDTDYSGGSLGLGQNSATPSINDVATTQIVLTNLTAGQAYDLSAWWDVGSVIFDSPYQFLTITVFGPSVTPIARRSWGGLKAIYK